MDKYVKPTLKQKFARNKRDVHKVCGTCKWWNYTDEIESDFPIGECRRYPPTAKVASNDSESVSFCEIKTFDDYWCGEYHERF